MSDLPKVLLLGDSIRMSYQPLVSEIMQDAATATGPADNCQYSLFTLSSLDRWIGDLGQPDIVHWNNGLHDCGHNPNRSPRQIPLDMYRANLEFILARLHALTPRVIWASNTPVHPQRPFHDHTWSWHNEEIDCYNETARALMEAHDVPVNDLHAQVWDNLDDYLSADQLHLSETGVAACAQRVASAISAQLARA